MTEFWWRPLIEVETSKVNNFLVVSMKFLLVRLIQPNETFLSNREISFLFQRLSVLVQRYNAILLHDCFVKEEEE